MKKHPAWGVDVTTVSVRGVQVALGPEGRPRIVAWDIVDYTEEVEDITSLQRFSTMGRGMFHFLQRHRLRRSRSWASLRAETAFNRTVEVPPVSDEGLDKILEYEAQQQVPHPLDEVYWDRRVLAIREDGEVLATLYAVRKALVEDRLRKFAKAGLPVDGIQLRPIALQNFCAYERLLEEGTILVDADYSGLHVLIHHGDQTWFRALPVGGVDLVTRLRETFDCNHRTAVRMASGMTSAPDAELFEACRREVAADIVDDAVRTVRYYLAARPDVRPSGVVLFESHGCVPPLVHAMKRALELPVFRPKGFRHLEVDPGVVTAGIQEHFASLAKAAGLALQGVGKAEVEARLFPEGLERNLDSRRAGFVAAAAMLLLLVLLAGFRRDAAADDVASALAGWQDAVRAGEQRAAVLERVNPEEPAARVRALAAPARDRAGPLRFVRHLYERHAAWEGSAPYLVSIRHDASDPSQATVVLAFQMGLVEDGAALDADAELERFAASLADGVRVLAVRPGETWTAGRMTHEEPIDTSERALRYRFRHRVFTLTLGEGS